jgi:hypothetical protein
VGHNADEADATSTSGGFDQEIGELNSAGTAPLTPYITQLATSYGLETYYFGTTHPSLPNYLSMISGDYFGIQDDNDSCFNPTHGTPCDSVDVQTLVDQLAAAYQLGRPVRIDAVSWIS